MEKEQKQKSINKKKLSEKCTHADVFDNSWKFGYNEWEWSIELSLYSQKWEKKIQYRNWSGKLCRFTPQ